MALIDTLGRDPRRANAYGHELLEILTRTARHRCGHLTRLSCSGFLGHRFVPV